MKWNATGAAILAAIGFACGTACESGAAAVAQPCAAVEMDAADPAASDQFGYSVAISGDVCIIGSRLDDAPAVNSGSAYVFRRDIVTGAWAQEAKLVAADGATGDEFGFSVAIFSNAVGGIFGGGGDIAVIGARNDDDHGVDSGSAYVFQHIASSWNQVAKLGASDGAGADHFGFAVAISGDFILVSARDDDSPSTNSGSVYAYRYIAPSWVFQAKLTPSDPAANDQFGSALSMDSTEAGAGAVAIIGAWHDDSPSMDAGSAYIFRYRSRTQAWSQGSKLTASDAAPSDEFGCSAAISTIGDTELAVIGARFNDESGSNSGTAYIYRHVGSAWNEEAKIKATDGAADDQFGQSVSLSAPNETALIGAWHNDQRGSDAGAAYLFRRDPASNTWNPVAKVSPATLMPGDIFGACVSLSGDRAIVGAYQADSPLLDAGAAYVFAGAAGIDLNDNGVSDACDVPGDISGDGVVDYNDLQAVVDSWGLCPSPPDPCPADFNGDGIVNTPDLLYVISHWS